jgi:hypothetical protein
MTGHSSSYTFRKVLQTKSVLVPRGGVMPADQEVDRRFHGFESDVLESYGQG